MRPRLGKPLPVLPVRDAVVFPRTRPRIAVGRPGSLHAIMAALERDRRVFVVAQRDAAIDVPASADLYAVGTVAQVVDIAEDPPGVAIDLEAGARCAVVAWEDAGTIFRAKLRHLAPPKHPNDRPTHTRLEIIARHVVRSTHPSPDRAEKLLKRATTVELADVIFSHLAVAVANKQRFLESDDAEAKITTVLDPKAIPFENDDADG